MHTVDSHNNDSTTNHDDQEELSDELWAEEAKRRLRSNRNKYHSEGIPLEENFPES